MKLSELAKKPQLIQVTIDDEDIVADYGSAIEFYTWDRQPMDVFLKLASINSENQAGIMSAVKELVLNEDGTPVITDEATLPTRVMMRVIAKVVEGLGKL